MISINSDVLHLRLQNGIFKSMSSLQKTLQRMMTGLKINSAADDPAGLYLATKFKTQIRGLEAANSNIQAALNLLGVTDTSIGEINDIMSEIRDLVQECTNEYLTPAERESKQKKINELYTEAKKIKENAEYNGNKLFANSTILDKNTTYVDGEPVGVMSTMSSRSFTPVATAAGMTLNRIGDVPEEEPTTSTTSTPTDGGEAAEAPTAAVMAMSLDDETGTESDTESAAAVPMMMSTRAAVPTIPTPGDTSIEGSDSGHGVEDWGTSGTKTLAAGESKTVQINGLTYTIENTSTSSKNLIYSTDADGQITFSGSHSITSGLIITAADGQDDKIILGTHTLTLNTGDGKDTIILDDAYGNTINTGIHNDTITIKSGNNNDNTINAGDGNDRVTLDNAAAYNTVDGGDGTDTIIDNSGSQYNTITNFEIVSEDWGTSGSKTIAAGETVTAIINGLTYTIENAGYEDRTLTYSTDANGQITLSGSNSNSTNLTITAADGQNDNIKTSVYGLVNTGDGDDNVVISAGWGYHVNTGDGNDNITIESGADGCLIDGGDGTDLIVDRGGINNTTTNFEVVPEDWGTSGSKTFTAGETKTVSINGMIYTIENNESYSKTISYSTDENGQIVFEGDYFNITAADGQADRLVIQGQHNTIYSGDNNDRVEILDMGGNVVDTGSGDDIVVLNTGSMANSVDGGDGTDIIIDNSGSQYNTITNFEIVPEDWGTHGIKHFTAGETKTAIINGLVYTVTNEGNSTSTLVWSVNDGQITFESYFPKIKVVAANGQKDNIVVDEDSNGLLLDTGDMDDIVTIKSNVYLSSIGTGIGNDTVILSSTRPDVTVDGGDGIDTIINSINNTTAAILNFETTEGINLGNSGSMTFESYQVETVTIDGKTYTIENQGNDSGELIWNVEDGQITFETSFDPYGSSSGGIFKITAEDGQEDNVRLYNSYNVSFYAGDGNDIITLHGDVYNSYVYGGDGADTYIISSHGYSSFSSTAICGDQEDTAIISGSSSGYVNGISFTSVGKTINFNYDFEGIVSLAYGESKEITVDGKKYIVTNESSETQTLVYGTSTDYSSSEGAVVFAGSYLSITAADGQEDNVVLIGRENILDTGDGDDAITLTGSGTGSNIIFGGSGDNAYEEDLYIDGHHNEENRIIDGSHVGFIEIGSRETKTLEIDGKTYTVTGGIYSTSLGYAVDDDGQITFDGDGLTIIAADGQTDNLKIQGHHNTVYTGDGDDKVNLSTIAYNSSHGYNTVFTGDGADEVFIGTSMGMYQNSSSYGSSYNNIDTGAGDDTITIYGDNGSYGSYSSYSVDSSSNNLIAGGEGNDNVKWQQYTYTGSLGFYNNEFLQDGQLEKFDDANETKTIEVDGKTYTVGNTSNTSGGYFAWGEHNGVVQFAGDNLTITAADGQVDNISVTGNHNVVFTGDQNDTIYIDGDYNRVDAGSGNDQIELNSNDWKDGSSNSNNIIAGGEGEDTGNIFDSYNEFIQDGKIIAFGANETKTLEIDGKTYTVTSPYCSNTLAYDVSDDIITFMAASGGFTINAAAGQTDNIKIIGSNFNVNTGDGEDTIVVNGQSNSLYGGADNDTITVENGSNNKVHGGAGDDTLKAASIGYSSNHFYGEDGTDTFTSETSYSQYIYTTENVVSSTGYYYLAKGETTELDIAGKKYTITNLSSSSSNNRLNWSISGGRITFGGSSIGIVAADGQDDNIYMSSMNYSTLDTGDGNDKVELYYSDRNTINTGTGSDTLILGYSTDYNTVNTGADNDSITLSSTSAKNNTVDGGDGTDSIKNSSNNTTNTITNIEINDFGTSGSKTFAAGETITAQVNGLTYTITNNNTSSSSLSWSQSSHGFSFTGNNFTVTAADGQIDKIDWNVSNGTLNTGDLDDEIYLNTTAGATINAGDGDDTLTLIEGVKNSTLDGGAGTDTITDNSGQTSNTVTNFEVQSIVLRAGQSTTVTIGGKTYTIERDSGAFTSTSGLSYSVDTNGVITFDGYCYNVTAADGQEDNIDWDVHCGKLNTGDKSDNIIVDYYSNTINAGEDDDTVTIIGSSHSNTIDGGYGEDTLIDNSTGGNTTTNFELPAAEPETPVEPEEPVEPETPETAPLEGSKTFTNGETAEIQIGDKTYTVVNNNSWDNSNLLSWSTDTDGQITFDGDYFTITAADDQEDNIKLAGTHNTLYTGDEVDTVVVANDNNTVYGGDGNDSITLESGAFYNSIDGGAGADTITLGEAAFGNKVQGGTGDDNIIVNGTHNHIYAGDDNDTITLESGAKQNTVLGESGTDTITDNSNSYNKIYENGKILSFEANETKTITTNGKTYTVTNNNSSANDLIYNDDGTVITFDSSLSYGIHGGFEITAASGQKDNIQLNSGIKLNTGDGADKVTINASDAVVNTGAGDDTVVYLGFGYNNTADGGEGTDTLINSGYHPNNTFTNFEKELEDWGTNGTKTIGASETVTVKINDLIYTITNNNSSSTGTISYSTDESGQITFDGNHFTISAAEGQKDNIKLAGIHNTLYTGDGIDSVEIAVGAHNNIIAGGAGVDTITDNSGKTNNAIYQNGEVVSFALGETQTIKIGNKTYTVNDKHEENDGYTNFIYETTSDGAINIYSSSFGITAADGQSDNIILHGSSNTLNTGDGTDNITIKTGQGGNQVNTGAGNDKVTLENKTTDNMLDGGAGVDTLIDNSNQINNLVNNFETADKGSYDFAAGETVTLTIDGKKYTVKNENESTSTLKWLLDNGRITFEGTNTLSNFTITAASGQEDNLNVAIWNGTVNTGDRNDIVYVSSGGATINTGTGADTITTAGGTSASINAGDGADTINITGGTVDAGAGNDIIYVTSSGATINAGAGDDTITYTDSVATAGDGYNTVVGGAGNDKIIVADRSTREKYTFAAGETITMHYDGKSYTITNMLNSEQTLEWSAYGPVLFDGNYFNITAADGQDDEIYCYVNNGILNTGDGDDMISVQGTHNIIGAGDGNDNVYKSSSDNIISGGLGNDNIWGISNNTVYQDGEVEVFEKGQTKTITIDGKKYTVQNNSQSINALVYEVNENGQITFDGKNFTITAASGQSDDLIINGDRNTVNTGDKDDNVTLGSSAEYNTVNTGNDDDKVVINPNGAHNTIYGGSGSNTYNDNSGNTTNTFQNFGNQELTFNTNETKTINIGDKTYTVQNNSGASNTLAYEVDQNGQITFIGSSFGITAADGQKDNIQIKGEWNDLNTGDNDDNIIISEGIHNSILGGDGDDTIVINSNSNFGIYGGTGNDTITNNATNYSISAGDGDDIIINNAVLDVLEDGLGNDKIYNNGRLGIVLGQHNTDTSTTTDILYQNTTSQTNISSIDKVVSVNGNNQLIMNSNNSVEVEIDGKKYTVDSNSYGTVLVQKENSGAVNFAGNIDVTAADNQKDNIIWNASGTLNTGNNHDTIYVSSTGTIIAGAGDDNITVAQTANNSFIQGDSGNDNITVNANGAFIFGGTGNDSVFINGDENEVDLGDGNDKINVKGNENQIEAGAGDDFTTILSGTNNYANGGATGYDKISNKGQNTTFTGMNELADKDTSYKIQTGTSSNSDSIFEINSGSILPELNLDVSNRDNALSVLDQIDEIMLGLTSSRVEIKLQQSTLDAIMKTNLSKITNYKTTQSQLIDADIAEEYNKLLEEASKLQSIQLLQTQLQQSKSNVFLSLIQGLGA